MCQQALTASAALLQQPCTPALRLLLAHLLLAYCREEHNALAAAGCTSLHGLLAPALCAALTELLRSGDYAAVRLERDQRSRVGRVAAAATSSAILPLVRIASRFSSAECAAIR